MQFETIKMENRSGVGWLMLNRPDKHNSMSGTMIEELTQAAHSLSEDEAVRVVVLAGEGPSFCAGGDLAWMKSQIHADRRQRMEEARKLAHMLRALNRLSKPLIGRIHGQAFGGGLGLMSVCDRAIAVEGLKFGLTEVRLGLIPATISPYVVARMGEAKAREVFMSAEIFDSHRARYLNLVSDVVEPSHLDAAIEQAVRPYFAAAPEAVAASKALVQSLGTAIDDAVIEDTINRLADTWENPESAEGIAAFFDKRRPVWAGGS